MREKIIAILQQHLSVTDEWGGCKVAESQFSYGFEVDGIEDAADEIIAMIINNKCKE